jgi:glycosyltransferase involved in cell wall biosynthesis
MKIFIISQGIPSSSAPLNGIFAWDQAIALRKLGHEVSVMALDFRRVFDRKIGKCYYKKDAINVYQYSLHTGIYRRFLPVLGRICAKVYKDMIKEQGAPDIIHSHFYFMGAILASMPTKPNVPIFITEHSSKLNKVSSQISKLDKDLAIKAYKYADRVVAVSSALSQKLMDNFSVKAEVVPDMYNLPKVDFVNKSKKFRVVSVGRLVEGKGFAELIDAFNMAEIPEDSELIIVGDGPLRSTLSKNSTDRVRFLGLQNRNRIVEYLESASVFALLSHSETFGVSYLEALSVGLPVLGTKCGGPSDFINEKNGILVEVGDVAAAAVALGQLYKGNYDSSEIIRNCEQNYSSTAVAKRLVELYESI